MVAKAWRQDLIHIIYSSRTEQVFEITKDTSPIFSHYTDFKACIECMWTK